MCGRLRCCMAYEFEQYAEARKTLPKRNKLVVTAKGQGKVVDVNPLKETIFVEVWEGEGSRIIELGRTEFEVIGAPGAPGTAAAASVPAPAPAEVAAVAPPSQAPRKKSKPGRGGQSHRRGEPPKGSDMRGSRQPPGDKDNGTDKPRPG